MHEVHVHTNNVLMTTKSLRGILFFTVQSTVFNTIFNQINKSFFLQPFLLVAFYRL